MLADEVGEKEHFQDGKYDDQLHDDNRPQRLSQRHVAKAVVVEVEDSVYQAVLAHHGA